MSIITGTTGAMRGGRGWLEPAAWFAALLLSVMAVYGLASASRLQNQLNHDYLQTVLGGELMPLLRAGNNSAGALYPALESLRDDPRYGLSWISVRSAEGIELSRVGVLDHWRVRLIPGEFQTRMRDLLYRAVWRSGSLTVKSTDDHLLGTVDFGFRGSELSGAHDEAVTALRIIGWLALGLALPLLVVVMRWRLARDTGKPDLARRADTPTQQTPNRGIDEASLSATAAASVLVELGLGLISVDREMRIRRFNAVAETLTGWSQDDVIGRPLFSVLHFNKGASLDVESELEGAIGDSRPIFVPRAELRRRFGTVSAVELNGSHLSMRGSGVGNVYLILLRDISSQAGELEALHRDIRAMQAVFDNLDAGVLLTDHAGLIRMVNEPIERMFGYSAQELVGSTISKLMPVPFLNDPHVRIAHYAQSGADRTLPSVVGWHKDATTFPVQLEVRSMRVDGDDALLVTISAQGG